MQQTNETKEKVTQDSDASHRSKIGMIVGLMIGVLLIIVGWFVLKDSPDTNLLEPATPLVETTEEQIKSEPETAPEIIQEPPRTDRVVIEEEHPEEQTTAPEPKLQPKAKPLPSVTQSTGPLLNDLNEQQVNTRPIRSENLVREFVVFVDNLAQGQVVRDSAMIKGPDTRFQVMVENETTWVDPNTYKRYDQIVDWFVALDNQALVQVYEKYEPLFDEAYAEISMPNASFRARLKEAIDTLEKTPFQTGKIALNTEKVMYRYADETLEKLPAAQRQMLRLGPDNGARVIVKLKDLYQSLDE